MWAIQHANLNSDRVFVGGSTKKNTTVSGDWDVDLVVFLHCSFAEYCDEKVRKNCLVQMGVVLETFLKCDIKKLNAKHIELVHKGVSFDILTAFDATKSNIDQVREQRVNMRELVKNRADKLEYSTCFTESSCEFLAKRRDESKERLTRAIKLCKLWNKTWFEKDRTHVSVLRSYALELMVCKVYDTKKELSAPDLFITMLKILKLAAQRKLAENWCTVTFNDFFRSNHTPDPSRPLRIFDPCFPESDVISDFEAWDDLADKTFLALDLIQSDTPVERIFSKNFM